MTATNQDQIQELQSTIKILKKLGTAEGFYQYFFEQLPKHRTNLECFNHVNDLHLDLFGEYRYSSWHSFRQTKHYLNLSKK
jgi:hypothetical protein